MIRPIEFLDPRWLPLCNYFSFVKYQGGIPVIIDLKNKGRVHTKALIHTIANGYIGKYNADSITSGGGWQTGVTIAGASCKDIAFYGSNFTIWFRFKYVTGQNGFLIRKSGLNVGWQFQEQIGNTLVGVIYHASGSTSISATLVGGFANGSTYDGLFFYNNTTKAMRVELFNMAGASILSNTGTSAAVMGNNVNSDMNYLINAGGTFEHVVCFPFWITADLIRAIQKSMEVF